MKKTFIFFRPGMPIDFTNSGEVKYAYEAEHLLQILADRFPAVNFIVVSKCEGRLSRPNVFHYYDGDRAIDSLAFIGRADGCIFMPGPNKKLDRSGDKYPDDYHDHVQRYENIVYRFLKEGKPVLQFSTDPRWHWDTIEGFENIVTFGQMEYQILRKTLSGKIAGFKQIHYNAIEHLSTSTWQKPSFDKDIHVKSMVIISNTTPKERFDQIDEYILKQFDERDKEIPIYGSILEGKSHRFLKGRLPYSQAWKEQERARLTITIPIEDGWVTSKYLECLYRGVLPIFHPSYDGLGLLSDIPDSLRAKSPEHFKQLFEFWLRNPSLREEVIRYLQSIYFDDYFQKGDFIVDLVRGYLE